MVLLEVDELLLQAFDLHLQVRPGQRELVQNATQSGDVGLHRQAHGHLVLEPAAADQKGD